MFIILFGAVIFYTTPPSRCVILKWYALMHHALCKSSVFVLGVTLHSDSTNTYNSQNIIRA